MRSKEAVILEGRNEAETITAITFDEESSVDDVLDWEFEREEEAEAYHANQLIEEYEDETFLFEGRVESLGEEDGAEFDFDQESFSFLSIQGDGVGKITAPTANNAETSIFRSFHNGLRTKGPEQEFRSPSTRHFAIAE